MSKPRALYALDLGHIESDRNWVLPMHSPATAAEPNRPATWAKVPTLAFLIDHPEAGWILFDTGCHPAAMDGHWPPYVRETSPTVVPPENHLSAQLALLGVAPADIGIVAISHLHMDHAGGLCHFAGTLAGRSVVVHRDELAYALLKTHESHRPYGFGYIKGDFADLDGISYLTVGGDHRLADGVQLLSLPGHTPGLLGLRVDLPESGTILLPSDCVYERRSYGPPLRPPASVYDTIGLQRSVDRLRSLETELRAQVLFSHDWELYCGDLRKAPEGYR